MSLKQFSLFVVYGPENRLQGVLLAHNMRDATLAAEGKWGVVHSIEEISDATLEDLDQRGVVFIATVEYIEPPLIAPKGTPKQVRVKRGW